MFLGESTRESTVLSREVERGGGGILLRFWLDKISGERGGWFHDV